MATQEEVILKLVTDVSDAKRELEEVKTAVVGIGVASSQTAKSTTGFLAAIKGVGLALKAAGLGLAIKAFSALQEVVGNNQRTLDFFNTAFEVLSIATNDFVNFVVENFGTVQSFFNDTFGNPIATFQKFSDALVKNIEERILSIIEVTGFNITSSCVAIYLFFCVCIL